LDIPIIRHKARAQKSGNGFYPWPVLESVFDTPSPAPIPRKNSKAIAPRINSRVGLCGFDRVASGDKTISPAALPLERQSLAAAEFWALLCGCAPGGSLIPEFRRPGRLYVESTDRMESRV